MFSISRIGQVLKALPRGAFDRIVQRYRGDRYVKRFTCWDQLVAMVYLQLAGASSLRELQAGFNARSAHHYHLGCRRVARTTLADANEKRNPLIFADVLQELIELAGRSLRRDKDEVLYLLDATTAQLPKRGCHSLRGHVNARGNHGVKLHVLFEAMSGCVSQASITPANVNDVVEGRKMALEAGATYVFDKGYCDYNWWYRMHQQLARWVTRFKRDAALTFICERAVPPGDHGVLRDSIVGFALRTPRGGHRNLYSAPLRRIEVDRPGQAPLVLATNDLHSPAAHIAALYKQRWLIELFFKWIKQHLQIGRFVGRNENAIRIQLLTALIAYVLVLLRKKAMGFTGTLWMLLSELRHNLFQRPQTEETYCRRRRAREALIASIQPALFR
jgi:IS4 transposase